MTKIYRAVVRGQFHDLTPEARATLAAEAEDHTVFRSAFTPEGTLTYDERLHFFNVRHELRERGDDGPGALAAAATERALALVRERLDARGFGYKDLKVTLTDMASVWE
ncbi:hypothetical protein KSP35_12645 [Aquihabitans sp. G128]|uniref:DUF6204 family protein n=1 Tax=Aquihabitans sp. G128 TaxID=2849779 RepID=UPI001C21854F|nr:DUF6204 family protein [Aquihabitans sp. G128]QXC59255.1 hypothetical protein KSP35_12645 [Aquihabitans sp. G128]